MRALIDIDPLLEPHNEPLPHLLVLWFSRRLTGNGPFRRNLAGRPTNATQVIQEAMNPENRINETNEQKNEDLTRRWLFPFAPNV